MLSYLILLLHYTSEEDTVVLLYYIYLLVTLQILIHNTTYISEINDDIPTVCRWYVLRLGFFSLHKSDIKHDQIIT